MAGHSKWANIQHRKGAQDKKRGKLFTKLVKEITVAARIGDPDPAANPRLRLAVDKAMAASMPKDNIERAIKRGAGSMDGDSYEEIRYEGYGPQGVAIMVDCMTDNRNRTVADVRHAFSKHGGNLGNDGSVAYLFEKKGSLYFGPGVNGDQLMEIALEAGAEDIVEFDDGCAEVLTDPDSFGEVRAAIEAADLEPAEADIIMRPATTVDLDPESHESVQRLLDALDDLDDVQNVYSNADLAE